MKIINFEKISKRKYRVTLDVSDRDIEMFEDWAVCDLNALPDEQREPYDNWMMKAFREFQKLWKKFDEVGKV